MRIAVPAVTGLIIVFALVLSRGGAWPGATPADASFHLMRVYGVMAGGGGDTGVQYVELRMTSGGQTNVGGRVICFFRDDGGASARFTFPSDVTNGGQGDSIIVGSAVMDADWGPAPDAVFGPSNTTAIAGGASTAAPVVAGSGKVAWGSDFATDPGQMCGASFSEIDSVAYGPAFSGTVDHGSAFTDPLSTAGTQVLKLSGQLCAPTSCVPGRDNSIDYELADTNQAGNEPRNNAGVTGPINLDGAPSPTPTPTPGPSPVGTPTPFVPPPQGLQGDVTCDFAVTAVDALGDLRYVAGLPQITQHEPCADIGTSVSWGVQGDVNCDSGAVTAVDALGILRYVAGLPPLSQHEPCPDVSTTV